MRKPRQTSHAAHQEHSFEDNLPQEPLDDPFSVQNPVPVESFREYESRDSGFGYGDEERVANTVSFADSQDVFVPVSYPYERKPVETEQPAADGFEAKPYPYSEEGQKTAQFNFDMPKDNATARDLTMEMDRIEDDAPPRNRDFRIVNDMPRRSRGKLIGIIVAGVVVGVVVAVVLTFVLGLWGGVAVPNVTGMTESDATRTLGEAGFSVRTTQVKSDETEGLVLISDPQAGSRAPEGSEVVIHIATTRFVPEIVGKTSDEAKAMLSEAGYENVRYDKEKSDGDENIVLSVSPDAGTRAKSNSEIVVKISEAYRVPSIDGLDLNAASAAISDAGLTPNIAYVDTEQYVDGTIIGTVPEAGAKASAGDYVTVNVARARGAELTRLTEELLAQGNTVTIGGVDYEMESVVSVSYSGNDTVSFTVTGRPKITFFGETLYASSSQTISGAAVWSESNELISIA